MSRIYKNSDEWVKFQDAVRPYADKLIQREIPPYKYTMLVYTYDFVIMDEQSIIDHCSLVVKGDPANGWIQVLRDDNNITGFQTECFHISIKEIPLFRSIALNCEACGKDMGTKMYG